VTWASAKTAREQRKAPICLQGQFFGIIHLTPF
jgi:hypothetical protein